LVVCYAVMSVITLLVYAWDKRAAGGRRRRRPESTLHLLALLGGWPGALLGQRLFKHKRQKLSFFAITWLIAAAHLAAWGWVGLR